jgi:hypothetical protein
VRLHHERTELQDEASRKNLQRGHKPARQLSNEDQDVICFPYGHTKPSPKEFSKWDLTDLARWELAGSVDPKGKGLLRVEHIEIGWSIECVEKRNKLLHDKVFNRKPTVKARKLLRFLIPKADGFPERLRRVKEMAENFPLLAGIGAPQNWHFSKDRTYLQQLVRIDKEQDFRGASIFQCLTDPDADIDLQTAEVVSPFVLVYSRFFCSKSAAGFLNAKKGVAKRRAAS